LRKIIYTVDFAPCETRITILPLFGKRIDLPFCVGVVSRYDRAVK